jgi:hypothetical protein
MIQGPSSERLAVNEERRASPSPADSSPTTNRSLNRSSQHR